MIEECVVAVYRTLDAASDAVRRLTAAGFRPATISLVTLALEDNPEVLDELKLRDDSLYDAAAGAGLGSVLGLLSGISVTVLSGLGIVFLVGPIGGAIMGGITGGFIGAMAGWGVHEHQIQHYERLVRSGNVLVIAHGDPRELANAYRLLGETDPAELHTYSRSDSEAAGVQG